VTDSRYQGETPTITIDARAERVTFFEDRAEVLRTGRGAVPAGPSKLLIEGVTLTIDEATLTAGIKGGEARVVGARVRRRVRQVPAASHEEIDALEREQRQAQRRLTLARSELEQARADLARKQHLTGSWDTALERAPRGPEAMATYRASFDQLEAAHQASFDRIARALESLDQAADAEQQAAARLALGRTSSPRHEAMIELQVESPQAQEISLEATYRTPCALWRPEHLAQLALPEGQGKRRAQLTLHTYATAWQATGERWENVRCRFSTARPAQAAAPPLLRDDVLSLRRKTEQEKQRIVVEQRDQSIAQAGLGRGVKEVDEMPGVDDGGEPLWLEARAPVTIPSDGSPVPVEVATRALEAEVDLIAYPERSELAHMRATATLGGGLPLLSGPVRLAIGPALVGMSKTRFVAAGEPFELGFGHDDDLRVRRRVEEKREVVPVIGTQKITRKVRLFVSNLSGAARALRLVERVPVSELREVQIEVIDAGNAQLDKRDGFATFELRLGPGETTELSLEYRIEAASKVTL
jgi:uncharacterized protein (TIGR02231 family)